MPELTGRSTTVGKALQSDASNAANPCRWSAAESIFPAGASLSMIFGTPALSRRYKTKVPLSMCLAFVSLSRLTNQS